MKKQEITTAATKAVANAEKVNSKVDYSKLYEELIVCKTKQELVTTMLGHGLYTSTKPTTTANLNDLYIQFNEKSRVLITSKSLKVYTSVDHANALSNEVFQFDNVNDGSYRTRRATVARNVENFIAIFTYFGSINAFSVVQK